MAERPEFVACLPEFELAPVPPRGRVLVADADAAAFVTRLTRSELASPAGTKAVPLVIWAWFASSLQPDLSAETARLWASRLRAAFAPDRRAAVELAPRDLVDLLYVLGLLGDADRGGLVREWFQGSRSRTQASPLQLALMAVAVHNSDLKGRSRLVEALAKDSLAAHAKNACSSEVCMDISRIWDTVGDGPTARQWAARAQALRTPQARETPPQE